MNNFFTKCYVFSFLFCLFSAVPATAQFSLELKVDPLNYRFTNIKPNLYMEVGFGPISAEIGGQQHSFSGLVNDSFGFGNTDEGIPFEAVQTYMSLAGSYSHYMKSSAVYAGGFVTETTTQYDDNYIPAQQAINDYTPLQRRYEREIGVHFGFKGDFHNDRVTYEFRFTFGKSVSNGGNVVGNSRLFWRIGYRLVVNRRQIPKASEAEL